MTEPRTNATPSPAGPERPAADRRRAWSIAWRAGLIAVVIVATVGLAHVLRNPGGLGGDAAAPEGAAPTGRSWPPPATVADGSPPPDAEPTTPQEADDTLRRTLAGLLVAALGDVDEETGEPEPPPEEVQRRVADLLGLPHEETGAAAEAGLVPRTAQVLMVVEHPTRRGVRMVLMRMRCDLGTAIETFYRHWEAQGWQGEDLCRPGGPQAYGRSQPDRGWLVHFRKGPARRLLYARPRRTGKETLLALYDPGEAAE